MSTEVNRNLGTNSAEITPDTNINLNIKIYYSYTYRLKANQIVDTICQFPMGRLCPLTPFYLHSSLQSALCSSHRGAEDVQLQRVLQARQDQPRSPPSHHQPVTEALQGLGEDARTSNRGSVQFKLHPSLLTGTAQTEERQV